MNKQTRQQNARKGIALVELALIFPIIFIMVLGMVETGNIYYTWLSVQKAAQIGARYASTGLGHDTGTRLSEILDLTQDSLVGLDSGSTTITVRSWPGYVATGDGADGDPGGPCQLMEVAVSYEYEPITPLLGGALPDTLTLEGADRKINEPWQPCGD